MEAKLLVCFLALYCAGTTSVFAGRAFPMESENYVKELFKTVNPNIEWDPTNFLINLSGQYSLCENLGKRGSLDVDPNDKRGKSVGALVDSYQGHGTDAGSIDQYLKEALHEWIKSPDFLPQIEKADQFGCSVQPMCKDSIVIACLFTPEYTYARWQPPMQRDPTPMPRARAFTPRLYDMTENVLGMKWDQTHFLENLSGYETDCAMMFRRNWFFPYAKQTAKDMGMHIEGQSGMAPNHGNTEAAIMQIIRGWKKMKGYEVGCSVIPDCKQGGADYAVVSCLYSM